jgi:hypothetical protein
MNQALITALQSEVNQRNILLMVPYMTPEDEILQALEEFKEATLKSKEIRAQEKATQEENKAATAEEVSAEITD